MSSTEATPTEDTTTNTTETRGQATSAAERLGGPIEGEQNPDRVNEADTAADEGAQRRDTARRAETSGDRETADVRRSETTDRAETGADRQADSGERQRTTLIEPERAESYDGRWNELKSEFVDDPRRAVRGANQLVGEVLDELEELFRRQRADLEHGLDSEQTTTEDLRVALGRYRSFFDRLLSF